MAAPLHDVRMNHGVTAVRHDDTGIAVSVRSDDGDSEVVADAVVIAVPVSLVLEIDFDPALPSDVVDAISTVPMRIASKLAVGTADRPPLRAIQDVEMPYWCWTGRGDEGEVRRAVTAFCGSPQAQQNLATDSGDPTTWLAKIQSANPDLEFVGEPLLVDWSEDVWARGCYSAFDNPAADVIPVLSKPVGRIFFAGEHTNRESATMEGALASGLRAADQVAESLSP